MTDDATPRVLRLRDAAEHVGVTEKALRRRIERGSLASLRVDGLLAVRVADLYAAGLHPVTVGSDAPEGSASRGTREVRSTGGMPQRGAGESDAIVALAQMMREQAEELGRVKALAERSESIERELVAERAALARTNAAYVEEQARAAAAEARVRELEERLAAAAPVVATPVERRGLLGRIFGG